MAAQHIQRLHTGIGVRSGADAPRIPQFNRSYADSADFAELFRQQVLAATNPIQSRPGPGPAANNPRSDLFTNPAGDQSSDAANFGFQTGGPSPGQAINAAGNVATVLGNLGMMTDSRGAVNAANALGTLAGAASTIGRISQAENPAQVAQALAPVAMKALGVSPAVGSAIMGFSNAGIPGAMTGLGTAAVYGAVPALALVDAVLGLTGRQGIVSSTIANMAGVRLGPPAPVVDMSSAAAPMDSGFDWGGTSSPGLSGGYSSDATFGGSLADGFTGGGLGLSSGGLGLGFGDSGSWGTSDWGGGGWGDSGGWGGDSGGFGDSGGSFGGGDGFGGDGGFGGAGGSEDGSW